MTMAYSLKLWLEVVKLCTMDNVYHGSIPALHTVGSYWTSRKNSLELIELSSINKVSLGFLL
jgi:hypothetical protein